jgi:hypothetical protein
MGLKGFHVVFISAAVLLAAGIAAWNVRLYLGSYAPRDLVVAGGAALAAAGLIAYEAWFLRKARRLP